MIIETLVNIEGIISYKKLPSNLDTSTGLIFIYDSEQYNNLEVCMWADVQFDFEGAAYKFDLVCTNKKYHVEDYKGLNFLNTISLNEVLSDLSDDKIISCKKVKV